MEDIRLDDSNELQSKENVSPKKKSILNHLERKISDNECNIILEQLKN